MMKGMLAVILAAAGVLGCGGGGGPCSTPLFACPAMPLPAGGVIEVFAASGQAFDAESGQFTAVVTIDGSAAGLQTSGDSGSVDITPSGLKAGTHTLRITNKACFTECTFTSM
jgi:hypothetical protein